MKAEGLFLLILFKIHFLPASRSSTWSHSGWVMLASKKLQSLHCPNLSLLLTENIVKILCLVIFIIAYLSAILKKRLDACHVKLHYQVI